MKVHVTLEWRLMRDPAERRAALERVLAAGRMTLANPGRFERYGVVTGVIDPANLERMRAVSGVLAAELDEASSAAARGVYRGLPLGRRAQHRPRPGGAHR